jgi:hypothetical protein
MQQTIGNIKHQRLAQRRLFPLSENQITIGNATYNVKRQFDDKRTVRDVIAQSIAASHRRPDMVYYTHSVGRFHEKEA